MTPFARQHKITEAIIPPSGPTCATCCLGGRCAVTQAPPGSGFLAPEGAMRSGVMLVSEALGAVGMVKIEQAIAGSGGFLMRRAFSRKKWNALEEFRFCSTLFCKPSAPLRTKRNGFLNHWAEEALAHCAPNLDQQIDQWKPKCIVALGDTAYQRLTGQYTPIMASRGYVFRERNDRCFVVPTFDPNFILKGNHALLQVFLWDLERARDIAKNGFAYESVTCLMDPSYETWEAYVEEFLADPTRPLAIDVETNYGESEAIDDDDDNVVTAVDPSYTINRFSCAFDVNRGASVRWEMPYIVGVQRMLEAAGRHA